LIKPRQSQNRISGFSTESGVYLKVESREYRSRVESKSRESRVKSRVKSRESRVKSRGSRVKSRESANVIRNKKSKYF
jgi:hypothetical protein